jgi:mannose-6-phosphate isomerase-like protein (cupin superfamily)
MDHTEHVAKPSLGKHFLDVFAAQRSPLRFYNFLMSEADMRKVDTTTADTYAIGDVEVARWEQYGLDDILPFGAMWYVAPPNAGHPVHCHPEAELSIVVSRRGVVRAGDDSATVQPGKAFLLASEEDHTARNDAADQPLVKAA